MPNPVFLYSAQIVAILSVLLLAAGYLKTDPRASSAQVFALMALMIVLYLLNGMTAAHIDSQFQLDLTRWELIISIGISSIPGLFMIYCFLIFQEEQKFPYTLGIAFAAQIFLSALLPLSGLFSDPFLPVGSWIYISYSQAILDVSDEVAAFLQLIFVIFAIYWTLKGWSADLVADRRILRWFNYIYAGKESEYTRVPTSCVYSQTTWFSKFQCHASSVPHRRLRKCAVRQ